MERTVNERTWEAVDEYLARHCLPPDPVLDAALKASAAAGLPPIQVSPLHGALLNLLASAIGARRILELGTLGGYSAIWLARALPPDGRLITLERDATHARVARGNLDRAGVAHLVELREGPALETLPVLEREAAGRFDLSFIDADKQNIAAYVVWAIRLSRPGALIVVDNVVRKGAILDAASSDEMVQGVRRFFEWLPSEPRVRATAIQMVGSKGYDGMAVLEVVRPA
jgi:predicted O-methyltransferase YrrM